MLFSSSGKFYSKVQFMTEVDVVKVGVINIEK